MTAYPNAYIDVRGFHPVLFIGMRSWVLENAPRSITVEQALVLVGLRPEPVL